jgi:hypothetical protein
LQVADLTFVGRQGWALGTVGCVQSSGRCTAIAHSTDNGRSWRSIVAPKVNVSVAGLDSGPCADPCVQFVRFATPSVGYLFGRGTTTALFMTTDGGSHWRRQPGGADALESLDGNVIRIDDNGGCPPGCTYRVRLASIGSPTWRTVSLPGGQGGGDSVQLVRTGSSAAIEVYGNPAGGGPARAVLFTSGNDGATWRRRGEPCPQAKRSATSPLGEVDSSRLSSAPDGTIAVLCTTRGTTGPQFVVTSHDGGAHFVAGGRRALGAAEISAFAAASASTLLVSSDDTYRSTDGGRHFARLSANSGGSPGALGWLGFASASVGHAISVDRRTIWSTMDGGRTWTAAALR